jgi:hypothetical protein
MDEVIVDGLEAARDPDHDGWCSGKVHGGLGKAGLADRTDLVIFKAPAPARKRFSYGFHWNHSSSPPR